MPGIVGYNTIGGASETPDAGSSTYSRIIKDAAYVAATGDTATKFSIYVSGGTGGTSVLRFGLWAGDATGTTPAACTLVFSDTISITATHKGTPQWVEKVISQSLASYVGQTLRVAFAGPDAGAVQISATSTANSSSSTNPGDGTNFPSPVWGGSGWDGSTRTSMYVTVTGIAGVTQELLLLGVG